MKKRPLVILLCSFVLLILGAVAAIVLPILTHQNGGSSGQNLAATFGNTVTATGDDGFTRTLTATDSAGSPANLTALSPGSTLKIKGSGYNSKIGIYVSFCKIPALNQKPSPCLGEIPASKESAQQAQRTQLASAWITDNFVWRSFATHSYSNPATGEFAVELTVPELKSNGLDCIAESCAIVTRADHTALNDRVQDLMLPVRFASH